MTTINLSIDFNEAQLTGIAQARTAFNLSLPEDSVPLTDVEYLQYVLQTASTSYSNQYSGSEPVIPSPITPVADWETLKNRLLGGDLNPIFQRLTLASLAPDANTISTARGDITDAVITIKVEAALASGLYLLTEIGGYVFTPEEKQLWQNAVDQLNFTPLVYLP